MSQSYQIYLFYLTKKDPRKTKIILFGYTKNPKKSPAKINVFKILTL